LGAREGGKKCKKMQKKGKKMKKKYFWGVPNKYQSVAHAFFKGFSKI